MARDRRDLTTKNNTERNSLAAQMRSKYGASPHVRPENEADPKKPGDSA